MNAEERIRAALAGLLSQESHSSWLGQVAAVGVAEKTVQKRVTSRLALKVYVQRKQSADSLTPSERVPPLLTIPGYSPIETDVEEIGDVRLESRSADADRVRPLEPGAWIGAAGRHGTLTAFARRDGDARVFAIASRHVVGGKRHTRVYQPPRDDDESAQDCIGHVVESSLICLTTPCICDVSLVEIFDEDYVATCRELGPFRTSAPSLRRGARVRLYGASSRLSNGIVRDSDFAPLLPYSGLGRVRFVRQVLCSRFSLPGDSGAPVVNTDGALVGMHLAGSDQVSIFTPFAHVASTLNIELVRRMSNR